MQPLSTAGLAQCAVTQGNPQLLQLHSYTVKYGQSVPWESY